MKQKTTITLLASAIMLTLSGCNSSSSDSKETTSVTPPVTSPVASAEPVTAPAMGVQLSDTYKPENSKRSMRVHAYSNDSDEVWAHAVELYKTNIENYNEAGLRLHKAVDSTRSDSAYPDFASVAVFDSSNTYATSGQIVKMEDASNGTWGIFTNKWWTQGDIPQFNSKSGPWELIAQTDSTGQLLGQQDTLANWNSSSVYHAGDFVEHEIDGVLYTFEAKYWTSGNKPVLTVSNGGTAEDWSTPWKMIDKSDVPVEPQQPEVPVVPDITTPPACEADCDTVEPPTGTPIVDPVIPIAPIEPAEPVEPIEPPVLDVDSGLPEDGYEFLRELTTEHWDWLFPMRSGRYVPATEGGATRNLPPIAKEDGSTDTFTLEAFKAAVVEYNTWAAANGYKQFLNEGSKTQQALEFTTFWAKSARETSGSWSNAPAPWIVDDAVAGKVWKGALYWVEEVGYSTESDGTSAAINYVDASSTYKPEPNRSYYGRGIIQLSWNYNYGAFSEWLYNNGMMKELITEKNTLLKRPDYVATSGKLSIMSGIWFWMTPQGAKPSSHDVIHGNMTHVSEFSQDQGLPQRHDGETIPTEKGDSTDQSVIAYRLGTVINIVNGGLECNKAAAWHPGPLQRVSYYNAYAKYINSEVSDINITTIDAATNVWDEKVTPSSHNDLRMATCYAQKSYYGW